MLKRFHGSLIRVRSSLMTDTLAHSHLHKTWCYHIWGNNHPLTSYFRVPRSDLNFLVNQRFCILCATIPHLQWTEQIPTGIFLLTQLRFPKGTEIRGFVSIWLEGSFVAGLTSLHEKKSWRNSSSDGFSETKTSSAGISSGLNPDLIRTSQFFSHSR